MRRLLLQNTAKKGAVALLKLFSGAQPLFYTGFLLNSLFFGHSALKK